MSEPGPKAILPRMTPTKELVIDQSENEPLQQSAATTRVPTACKECQRRRIKVGQLSTWCNLRLFLPFRTLVQW